MICYTNIIMKFKYIFFSLFILLISSIVISDDQGNTFMNKINGDWAIVKWHDVLIKTKSPRQAILAISKDKMYLSHLKFINKKNSVENFEIGLNYSFNEGGALPITKIISATTRDFKVYTYGHIINQETENAAAGTISFLNENKINVTLQLLYRDFYGVYVRIEPSLEYFVNTIVLAGKYRDDSGNNYKFQSNGEVVWKNDRKKYQIGHGVNGIRCDYMFINPDIRPLERYSYEFKDKNLILYDIVVNNDGIEDKSKNPVLILHKVK